MVLPPPRTTPPSRARRVREALAFAALACACGLSTLPSPPPPPAPASAPTAAPTAAPSFPDLEARWSPRLPGMRVLGSRAAGVEPVEIARAADVDLCVRVAFDATEPVRAVVADSTA